MLVVLPTYDKRAMKLKSVCPLYRIVKDQIAKVRTLGIKRVSIVDINFDSFSLAKLY